MSQLFAWGGQSTGVPALASFPPKKSQGWSPSEFSCISLQSKGLSRVFSNTTVQKHQFFGTQPSTQSNSHIHNPAQTFGSSWFKYCWILAWRILNITLLSCEMSAIVLLFEHSLALPFFWIGMKTDPFQPCGHCWVFQICWHIECSTFTASSFGIWNSSTEIAHLH